MICLSQPCSSGSTTCCAAESPASSAYARAPASDEEQEPRFRTKAEVRAGLGAAAESVGERRQETTEAALVFRFGRGAADEADPKARNRSRLIAAHMCKVGHGRKDFSDFRFGRG